MKSDFDEAKLSLWFRVILLAAFCTIIGAIGKQQSEYNALAHAYHEYRVGAEHEIESLEVALDSTSKQAKKAVFVQKETECLAKNIYFEAGMEPYAGMLAVATVTKNRVQNKEYPKTYCGVVYQKHNSSCQFSWTCDSRNDRIRNSIAYQKATKIAEDVLLKGKRSGIIDRNVMFYHADYITPYWAASKDAVTKIGTHIFYR